VNKNCFKLIAKNPIKKQFLGSSNKKHSSWNIQLNKNELLPIMLDIRLMNSDKNPMDNSSLIGILGQLFFICIILLVMMNLMKAKQKSNQQGEIQKMVARLANLRLILKAKVKKKSNYYRNVFPQAVMSGDMIDSTLSRVAELKFETGTDFQTYIDSCRVINQYLKVSLEKYEKELMVLENKRIEAAAVSATVMDENHPENTPPVAVKKIPTPRRNVELFANQIEVEGPYNFMTPDMKTEFSIIKIIDEIVQIISKIKEKLIVYNRENPKKPLPMVEPIDFPSLPELRRINNENSDIKPPENILENRAS
jgi:hypothetical protein